MIKRGDDTIKIGNKTVRLDDYIKAMHSDGNERRIALHALKSVDV